ncbi:ASCH domain-containing protein [Clostridium sp. Mt-5]|uniref:ASCH domain-containing protein n=1 Tax=Clostridium moutaii TaxID=3240932 RepID=A0ABV4BN68_9CLOT
MKVLTIRQPWASLIALGEKHIETRSWKTNYRGPLLIHAGKNIDKQALKNPIIRESLKSININEMPIGMIIAKCNLVDCAKVKSSKSDVIYTDVPRIIVEGKELIFGDYSPGRYAWILDNIEPLRKPVSAKGQLSLWEYRE